MKEGAVIVTLITWFAVAVVLLCRILIWQYLD
jgi:hypothetical protein